MLRSAVVCRREVWCGVRQSPHQLRQSDRAPNPEMRAAASPALGRSVSGPRWLITTTYNCISPTIALITG